MLILPVAAASSRQPPAVIIEKPNQVPDFHALLDFIRAAV